MKVEIDQLGEKQGQRFLCLEQPEEDLLVYQWSQECQIVDPFS